MGRGRNITIGFENSNLGAGSFPGIGVDTPIETFPRSKIAKKVAKNTNLRPPELARFGSEKKKFYDPAANLRQLVGYFFNESYLAYIKQNKCSWKHEKQRYSDYLSKRLGGKLYDEVITIDVQRFQMDMLSGESFTKSLLRQLAIDR